MAFSDRLRVQTGFDRLSRAGLVGALLVACTLVVVLARQAAALRDRNARLTQAIVDPARGMWVPTFTAVTLDGDTVRVGESDAGGGQLAVRVYDGLFLLPVDDSHMDGACSRLYTE